METVEIEQATWIAAPFDLSRLDKKFRRVYIGSEFCERLLPTEKALRRVVDSTVERNLYITLATPFLTDAGLSVALSLLRNLEKNPGFNKLEVVVNDFGLLNLIEKNFPGGGPVLLLGRLLAKMKRGPRGTAGIGELTPEAMDHFQRTNADVPRYSDFLRDAGFSRIELDYPLQGLKRDGAVLEASLHYPFVYVAAGRYCQFADLDNSRRDIRSVSNCSGECASAAFRMEDPRMPVPIIVRGNVWSFENQRLPDEPGRLRITRFVFSPAPPP